MATHQSALTSISDFFSPSEVVTTWQTDGAAHKLKPRSFHKSTVVATTHYNGTCSMLTSAKLLEGYLVVGITRELDKEPSLHCYPIYISYRWSMLQQCVYLMFTPQ